MRCGYSSGRCSGGRYFSRRSWSSGSLLSGGGGLRPLAVFAFLLVTSGLLVSASDDETKGSKKGVKARVESCTG